MCQWQHGQEFVFLSPQDTQAALIHGLTLHAFANIRVKSKQQASANTFTPEQFVQYQRLHWMVFDECSTVGLEGLGTLEKRLTQSTRDKGTWKLRSTREIRPFAGMNVVITGDMWQFPPVKATAILQNPFCPAAVLTWLPYKSCFGPTRNKPSRSSLNSLGSNSVQIRG